jgi:hypothetical protein
VCVAAIPDADRYLSGAGLNQLFSKTLHMLVAVRQKARDGHLGMIRQLFEMAYLRIVNGVGPGYYQASGLWHKDIPWNFKRKQLSVSEYRRRLKILNPPDYRKLSQNKISEKAIFEFFRFPTPEFLGFFHPANGRTREGNALTSETEMESFLSSYQGAKVCFKDVEGWSGRAFRAATVVSRQTALGLIPLPGDDWIDFATYFRENIASQSGATCIIERYLEQHPWCMKLNPTSVNTLRLYAIQGENEKPIVIGGFLRMGTRDVLTDSTATGGICAIVHLETGKLISCHDNQTARKEFTVHPTTGAQIVGELVPFWPDAKQLACDVLAVFPSLRFAGIDIALTDRGPSVIEMNVHPDHRGMGLLLVPPSDALKP